MFVTQRSGKNIKTQGTLQCTSFQTIINIKRITRYIFEYLFISLTIRKITKNDKCIISM